jgi:hypothetical protein
MNVADASAWKPFSSGAARVDVRAMQQAIEEQDKEKAAHIAYGRESAAILLRSEKAGFHMFSCTTRVPLTTPAQSKDIVCDIFRASAQ